MLIGCHGALRRDYSAVGAGLSNSTLLLSTAAASAATPDLKQRLMWITSAQVPWHRENQTSISRYAWIGAGRVSSRDPQALFQIQRRGRYPTAAA
jgi:hypothetical protein